MRNSGEFIITGKIRVLIVDDIPETRESLKTLISFEEDMEVVGEASSGAEALASARVLRPDVALMDINMPVTGGIEATEAISLELPEVGVIIMSVRGEQECLREAMAAGAREYLVKPFSGDELVKAIKRVHDVTVRRRERRGEAEARQPEAQAKGRVIAVMSTKGGVGKTTISTNLAVALALETKRRVALVDLDLQFGDVALMLDVVPRYTIADLAKAASIDLDLLTSCMVPHKSGVDVLASPLRPEESETVLAFHVETVLRLLVGSYDYVVVDTAQSLYDAVLTALDMADTILLITTLDLPTIKNAKLCLELLKSLKYEDSKVKIVLNRSSSEIGVHPSEMEKSIHRRIDAHIPSEGRVVVPSVNRGVPFVVSDPSSKVARGLIELARLVASGARGESFTDRFAAKIHSPSSRRFKGILART